MPEHIRMYFSRRNIPAWIVLAICLLLLVLAQRSLLLKTREHAAQAFEDTSQEIISALHQRLNQHEQILLGGAALIDASATVDRAGWHIYVNRLNLEQHYPGIQGVGFTQIIQPRDLPAHIAKIRAQGFPDYTVRPPGERALYTSIIFLEPFTGRNLAAFGYDMMSETTRARALRRAVDENKTTITGKVKLVQENQGKPQAGFLMYVPVYRKRMQLTTIPQRWAALEGYVYSPYRMNDLMHGIMGSQTPRLDFSIYDGDTISEDTLMYASADDAPANPPGYRPQHERQLSLHEYGHTWRVKFQSRPEFDNMYQSTPDIAMLVLGSSTSIMVFLLISMLTIRSSRAEAQALLQEKLIVSRTGQLREALEFLTAILDNAGHAIIATNPDGVITAFNTKAEQLLGYRADEMVNKQTPAVFHDLEEVVTRAKTFSAELNTRIEPGFEVFVAKSRLNLPNEHEWTYVRKNGSRFPVSLSVTALRNNENQITGFLGVAADISTQKNAEQSLRENAEQTQAVLDNVVDGIITINDRGIVQSYNRSAERIFGYSTREVIGNNINMLMPEPYHSAHDGYLESYRATGMARIIGIGREVEGQRKDGSVFPMDLAVSQSTHQGQPLFIGLVRDITERKRVEKMKSEFVSTVSHELRTPLTAISGSLGLIIGGALGDVPVQMKQMLDLAHKNSLRLTSLINDLLDMEKLAAGRLNFDMKVQALMPLIEQNLQSIQAYAEQYRVHFVLVSRTDDVYVRVDGMRLQQVLSNFLSNAAKFSPEQGQINVAVSQRNNMVRVEVIDQGPGISEEFRKRIFQKFSQADSSDSRQKGGTGLGLAISKELIERMHGRIGFESTASQGTHFYFELPIEKKHPVITTSQHNNISGAPHVLVVEDDADIGRLFSIMLSKAGYNVDLAQSAEIALAYLDQHKYDAMTLDLNLPDQSGTHLIRVIRSQAHTETLPIIVISAYSSDGKLAINGDFSAIDWLEKPVSTQQLIDAIHRALPSPSTQVTQKPRILHVEDDAVLSEMISILGSDMADIEVAPTLAAARSKLKQSAYNLIVIDISLPDGNGMDLLPELEKLNPKPPVIVLSGSELNTEQRAAVQSVLVKSHTSNEEVLQTLRQLLASRTSQGDVSA